LIYPLVNLNDAIGLLTGGNGYFADQRTSFYRSTNVGKRACRFIGNLGARFNFAD
jgi:hypothetical protein